ncbi:MAG: hypothetical protein QXD04_01100 [Candidatus Bathyarchaeia archaeon]|nr:hypothetical protein [Candidatus Bathyarchaeota archaeon]
MSVSEAIREIEAIEGLISPYAYYSYDAERVLAALRDLKDALNRMDKDRIRQIMEGLSNIESMAAPYRGYSFVEEALEHSKRLLTELTKIVEV